MKNSAVFTIALIIGLSFLSVSPNILASEVNKIDLDSKKLHGYLQRLQSYSANFQQQLVSSTRRLMETTSGEFVMKRPNKFRWQIFTPYEQSIIADGKSIWSIDIDLEQVTITDIDENIVNSPIMLLSQNNDRLNEIFTVEELINEESISAVITESQPDINNTKKERFLLKPIDNSSNFERVVLGFNDGILYLIELHDSLGQITIVTMTNIRNNPILGEDNFIYIEMPDFDVIDSRESVVREKESDGQ